ncbi:MAG: hypothetical protein WCF60_16610 [Anaerobacillus sp.]
MRKYSVASHKEITARYIIITLLLSSTIFLENYSIPLWAYSIGILIMLSHIFFNVYKWIAKISMMESSKEELVRDASMIIVASLFLIVPLNLNLWIGILYFVAALIALIWEYKRKQVQH